MLDSIYHMTLKLLKICIFGGKMSRFCQLCNFIMLNQSHYVTLLSLLSILLYGVKPFLDATSCDKYRIYKSPKRRQLKTLILILLLVLAFYE